MIVTEEQMVFLKEMQDAGIVFSISVVNGESILGLDDVPRYLNNHTEFLAAYHNVTVERYLEWSAHVDTQQCSAITSSDARCKNFIERTLYASQFRPGVSDRCFTHRVFTTVPLAPLKAKMSDESLINLLKRELKHRKQFNDFADLGLNIDVLTVDLLPIVLDELGVPPDTSGEIGPGGRQERLDGFCRDWLDNMFEQMVVEGTDEEMRAYMNAVRTEIADLKKQGVIA